MDMAREARHHPRLEAIRTWLADPSATLENAPPLPRATRDD
jgi:hypothetical protein